MARRLMTKRSQFQALLELSQARDDMSDANRHLNNARCECHLIWTAMRKYLALMTEAREELDDLMRQIERLPVIEEPVAIEAPTMTE